MSMDYIRETYSVPARRGQVVEYHCPLGGIHRGVIVGSRGMYIRVRMPTLGSRDIVSLHPTSNVRYLPAQTPNAETEGATERETWQEDEHA